MADLSNPVDQIESGQAAKEVTANELFDAASPAMIFGRRAETSAGLIWGYYGGRYRGTAIAHGTQTVTANQANIYMVAAKATGVVSFSTGTTNWNDATNYDRLYWMSTGPTTITDYDDYREVVSSAGAGVASIDTETIQDIVGAMVVAGTNVSVTYNDAFSPATLVIDSTAGGASLTSEQVEDIVGSLVVAGTNVTVTYNDSLSPPTLVIDSTGGGTPLTSEQVEDIVGALLVAGTNVTLTYDDAASPPTLTVNSTAAAAAGTNTQLQYNNSGVFGASPAMTFDGAITYLPSVSLTTGDLNLTYLSNIAGTASTAYLKTVSLAASSTGSGGETGARLKLPHGAVPTSPADGDVWTTTAGLFVQINGSTVGPLS